mgnify:FL=1
MPQFNIQLINQPKETTKGVEKKEVVVGAISDGSTTSKIYESRAKYKEDVNKNNLPMGNFGSFDKPLSEQEKKLKELQEEYDELLQFFVQYPDPEVGSESIKKLAEKENLTEAEAEVFWSAQLDRADNLKLNKSFETPSGQNKIEDEFEGIIPDLEADIENLKIKNSKPPPSLRNQLDTWYERQTYGRLDYKGRAIISEPNKLINIGQTEFRLQDFAANAAESFLNEYNIERPTHPNSKLNNITIKRAYVERNSYDEHVDDIYVDFFNQVLDPIKNTNKIINLTQFSNLFYNWFIDQGEAITDVGFLKRQALNIYNTGLAFDYFNINTEKDKQDILNDPRFPVINYVAKINGLKVDPNYPARLIADVYSTELINRHMPENIKSLPSNDIPKVIFTRTDVVPRFSSINFGQVITVGSAPLFGLDQNKIYKFITTMQKMYNRLIKKYPTYINYTMSEEFKRKFETSKIKRASASEGVLIKKQKINNFGSQFDINSFFIELYIKVRAKEEGVVLSNTEIKSVKNRMVAISSVSKIPSFFTQPGLSLIDQLRQTALQPDNLLELFLQTKKSTAQGTKRGLVFSWSRAFD